MVSGDYSYTISSIVSVIEHQMLIICTQVIAVGMSSNYIVLNYYLLVSFVNGYSLKELFLNQFAGSYLASSIPT